MFVCADQAPPLPEEWPWSDGRRPDAVQLPHSVGTAAGPNWNRAVWAARPCGWPIFRPRRCPSRSAYPTFFLVKPMSEVGPGAVSIRQIAEAPLLPPRAAPVEQLGERARGLLPSRPPEHDESYRLSGIGDVLKTARLRTEPRGFEYHPRRSQRIPSWLLRFGQRPPT